MRTLRPHHEVLDDWAPELAERLGRPAGTIRARRLRADDFSASRSVEIRSPDGRVVRVPLAFAVVRPASAAAAVFSEHSGYLEFDLEPDTVVVHIDEAIVHRQE